MLLAWKIALWIETALTVGALGCLLYPWRSVDDIPPNVVFIVPFAVLFVICGLMWVGTYFVYLFNSL